MLKRFLSGLRKKKQEWFTPSDGEVRYWEVDYNYKDKKTILLINGIYYDKFGEEMEDEEVVRSEVLHSWREISKLEAVLKGYIKK